MQGPQNKNKEHYESRCTVYFDLRVQDYNDMVIKIIKLRNIAVLSIDKVHCRYFDEGSLQVSLRCESPQHYNRN